MATVVTTLNYLDGVMAGNVLMNNGGFKSISHEPAVVAEAYTDFTADGTFAPQGGSSDLTALIVAGGGGGGAPGYGSGGGGGGIRTATDITNPGSPVAITVGGGGATASSKGENSEIGPSGSLFLATGGGLGPGASSNGTSGTGGSGGGNSAGNEGGYSPVEGYAGGAQQWPMGANPAKAGAGGGGGAVGQPGPGGRTGGAGLDITPTIPAPEGGTTMAGGGAGGAYFNPPAGGGPGGGGGVGSGGGTNQGGGGGGQGGNGGSGRVIIKEIGDGAVNTFGIWNMKALYKYKLADKWT